jgi:hypothetical protein
MNMIEMFLDEEASLCRQRALSHLGRPEASFLMKAAASSTASQERGRRVGHAAPAGLKKGRLSVEAKPP